MQKRLIKYLKENFNAESITTLKATGYSNLLNSNLKENFNTTLTPIIKVEGVFETFHSDLHVSDLPELAKAFEGTLTIDDDGDALVDNCDNLYLHIRYDKSPFENTEFNRSVVTILNGLLWDSGF